MDVTRNLDDAIFSAIHPRLMWFTAGNRPHQHHHGFYIKYTSVQPRFSRLVINHALKIVFNIVTRVYRYIIILKASFQSVPFSLHVQTNLLEGSVARF